MNSSHSEAFVYIVMAVVAVVPAIAYLVLRLFGAHEAASDHPVVHHRHH